MVPAILEKLKRRNADRVDGGGHVVTRNFYRDAAIVIVLTT